MENSESGFAYKWIVLAIVVMIAASLMFSIYVPRHGAWEDEIRDIESTYYGNSGSYATPAQNIWTLTGIYTPYSGDSYGYDRGWIYGEEIVNNTPEQYTAASGEQFTVQKMDNGLYYYTSAPANRNDIKVATYSNGSWNYDGATIYSAVTMDVAHKSDIFFTTSSKVEMDGHYYYAYTGYRYAFSSLEDYYTNVNGETVKVSSDSSQLSLIWYQYNTLSGVSGQLSINDGDYSVSYLSASDIVAAYNEITFSSTFDMTFSGVKMHLLITLNPTMLAHGMTVADCYNAGYWSVMVYSDAILAGVGSSTYSFSLDNLMSTLIDLMTFNIAEDYKIDGYVGVLAGLFITMPLYAALFALALQNKWLWIVTVIIAAIQSINFFHIL